MTVRGFYKIVEGIFAVLIIAIVIAAILHQCQQSDCAKHCDQKGGLGEVRGGQCYCLETIKE